MGWEIKTEGFLEPISNPVGKKSAVADFASVREKIFLSIICEYCEFVYVGEGGGGRNVGVILEEGNHTHTHLFRRRNPLQFGNARSY